MARISEIKFKVKLVKTIGHFWKYFTKLDQNLPIFGFARLFSQVSRDCETISESRLARDRARLCHTNSKIMHNFEGLVQDSCREWTQKLVGGWGVILVLYFLFGS